MNKPLIAQRNGVKLPRFVFCLIFLWQFLFHFPTIAHAQFDPDARVVDTPGLTIDVHVGWDGYLNSQAPVPMSFLLRNDTGRNVEGILTLENRAQGLQVSLGDVFLATGTNRSLTTIQSLAGLDDCLITLRHQRDILWQRKLDLQSGKSFLMNRNYALFIDEKGRKFELHEASAESATLGYQEYQIAGKTGRMVDSLSITPWQLPNHPGPLFVAQAMIFPEGTDERSLNAVQWKAVSEWMCQGGVIFVHQASDDLLKRIVASSPLGFSVPENRDPFRVRKFGLGALYEYQPALFTGDRTKIKQAISEVIAVLSKDEFHAQVETALFFAEPEGQVSRNRNSILSFFGVYTLFAGGGALMLYRWNQKSMAIYTATVVAVASLLAGMLGGYLRLSRGDLQWLTISIPGKSGLVQIGCVEVQSAGSRNTRVGIRGDEADLQFLGKPRVNRYDYWRDWRQNDYPAFTWQPNRKAEESDGYVIEVPMSPWGRRRCHATTYRRDVQPLEVDLQFQPAKVSEENEASKIPPQLNGEFSLKVTNHLPFDLLNCWIVIGASQTVPPVANMPNTGPAYGGAVPGGPNQNVVDGMIDVYQVQKLSHFIRGNTEEKQFAASFQSMQNNWSMSQVFPDEMNRTYYRNSFRIPQMGATRAWIVGQISKSPAMEIDEERSDFIPDEGTHIFIQPIDAEELPDTLKVTPLESPGESETREAVE